ncbi:MAG: enoyl-CoA hydratase/isomerase family protein [Alphaproteobacteria bacterium]|nr:enoyl-CoA hydratase/isomerase family protein [Alphaproteobacteria bacterium]
MTETDDILFDVADGIAVVILNRPAALNALTLGMIYAFEAKLRAWAADPDIRAVVVRGAGEKGFCAGGDIRALYDGRGTAITRDFFFEEYRLNHAVFHFPKPYIALMDGITMGGGVGLSVHASHRVVCEPTLFAMPETGIGLFPDVGGSYFLPRLPGAIGMYMGLTGARLRAADCLYAGIADVFVPVDRHDALIEGLRAGATPEDVLEALGAPPDAPPLAADRAAIDRCFSAESVELVIAALDAEATDWSEKTAKILAAKSPSSLKITFRKIRAGATMDFDDCMKMEFRISQHVMARDDFYEGVRAVVIDKDQAPNWRPDRLDALSDADIAEYFAPLDGGALTFD